MNETEVLQEFYSALNRNDIPAMINLMDSDIVRVEPEGFPASGTYRGQEAILAHFTAARGTWAEGSCNPEQFINVGDKFVVLVHVHVRLKDKTDWIDGHVADGFAFKNGKISHFQSFLEKEKALKWAEQ
ncbi:nuclear transport factor 2 family protein [Bdellovibrio sp. NC01]|uniref:nuclear transport factor 2 family protein n=1 Tax=Bdellovibrio sp. NC01 TaxID=2220073 RepID=UPI00115BCEA6|nr:nuclear transport factor 2 family protein [Bdellovibrio sp. NC01]